MKDMLGGMGAPGAGQRVTITQTPGGVSMRVSGPIGGGIPPPGMIAGLHDDDDDDDAAGIPPEILEIIKMTEMLASGGGPLGGPGIGGLRRIGGPPPQRKPEDNTPRHEESVEDIMARMNKLSDEIGEKHENKYKRVESQQNRMVQIFVVAGAVMMIMLVSFIMTCRANA